MEKSFVRESLAIKVCHVFISDTNNHGTLFGGKLMSYIDDIASVSAMRHSRKPVVTASTDSVDFLAPISTEESVCLESFVTWAGTSSMEVFVKVIAENLLTAERTIAATAFFNFCSRWGRWETSSSPRRYTRNRRRKILTPNSRTTCRSKETKKSIK